MICRIKIRNIIKNPLTLKLIISQELYKYLKLNLTGYRAQVASNYLKSSFNISWSCMQILLYAINNLKITGINGDYYCSIDNNILLPGTKYKLISIVKMINYGTPGLLGNHIMSKAFEHVERNIGKILLRMIW